MSKYRTIVEPIIVYRVLGSTGSRTILYGAMAHGAVLVEHQLASGDQVHEHPDGLYALLSDGQSFPIRLMLDEEHPLDSSNGARAGMTLPGEVASAPIRDALHPHVHLSFDHTRLPAVADPVGESLDWLVRAGALGDLRELSLVG